jgi:hypothetical protein
MKTDATQYPKPEEIVRLRKKYGKTQAEACAIVKLKSIRSWQQAEAGKFNMHPAFLDLFIIRCELELRKIKI